MWEAILSTLGVMGWLGVVLAILVIVNTTCGIIRNLHDGQVFSWKVLFKGLGKAFVYYASAVLTSIAFTMLPFINALITNTFQVELFANDTLQTLSAVAVVGVVIASVITQGKKALEGVIELSGVSVTNKEEITWEVRDPLTDEPMNKGE